MATDIYGHVLPYDCIYCHDTGTHGDEFTGGTSYCACKVGAAVKKAQHKCSTETLADEIRRLQVTRVGR